MDGPGTFARFKSPGGLATSSDRSRTYVIDAGNLAIKRIMPSSYSVETLAFLSQGFCPSGMAVTATSLVLSDTCTHTLSQVSLSGQPNQTQSLLSGSGAPGFADGAVPLFFSPMGVAASLDGVWIYLADHGNRRIRMVNSGTGAASTLAGSGAVGAADGNATLATFSGPTAVALSATGRSLYVLDGASVRSVVLTAAGGRLGAVTTILSSTLSSLASLAVPASGAALFMVRFPGHFPPPLFGSRRRVVFSVPWVGQPLVFFALQAHLPFTTPLLDMIIPQVDHRPLPQAGSGGVIERASLSFTMGSSGEEVPMASPSVVIAGSASTQG